MLSFKSKCAVSIVGFTAFARLVFQMVGGIKLNSGFCCEEIYNSPRRGVHNSRKRIQIESTKLSRETEEKRLAIGKFYNQFRGFSQDLASK